MKKILILITAWFVTVTAYSDPLPFQSGQVLTATQLNNAFASVVSSTQLQSPVGATLVGTNDGSLSNALALRPKLSDLAASTGSSEVGFVAPFTNASVRTVSSKLADRASAADFGCVGDGVADNSACLAKISASTIGEVDFPQGIYKFFSPWLITRSNLHIVGAGKGATTLLGAFDTGDIISIGDGSANPNNTVIEHLTVASSVQKTQGAAIRFRNGHNLTARDIRLDNNLNWGVQFDGGVQQFGYYLENFEINSGSNQIIIGDDGTLVQDLFIRDGIMANATGNGFLLENVSGFQFSDIDIINAVNSFATYPNAGKTVQAGVVKNVLGDTASNACWNLITNGGMVADIVFDSIWASTCGGSNAISIANGSGNIDGLTFNTPRVNHNAGTGFYLAGGKNIYINSPMIFSNSTSSSGTYSGIEVASNVSNWSVTGGVIGNGGLWGSYSQMAYGIKVNAGNSNYYRITGVNLTGNKNAGIYDAGTGTGKVVKDNPGYNPIPNTIVATGASPYSWDNLTGAAVSMYVNGGAVSSITVDGNKVAAQTDTSFPVPAGSTVIITYTSIPTVSYTGS